jgi:hypothetical protein
MEIMKIGGACYWSRAACNANWTGPCGVEGERRAAAGCLGAGLGSFSFAFGFPWAALL